MRRGLSHSLSSNLETLASPKLPDVHGITNANVVGGNGAEHGSCAKVQNGCGTFHFGFPLHHVVLREDGASGENTFDCNRFATKGPIIATQQWVGFPHVPRCGSIGDGSG